MFFPGEIDMQTPKAEFPLCAFTFPFTYPLDMVPGKA